MRMRDDANEIARSTGEEGWTTGLTGWFARKIRWQHNYMLVGPDTGCSLDEGGVVRDWLSVHGPTWRWRMRALESRLSGDARLSASFLGLKEAEVGM